MPNIAEQRADSNGLYVKATDGREVTVTTANIVDQLLVTVGDDVTKRLVVRLWVKNAVVAALGPEQIDINFMDVDFNALGEPTILEFRSE